MDKTEYERLAVVEEQTRQLLTSMKQLSEDLRSWQMNYLPREEANERLRAMRDDIQELREAIKGAPTSKDIEDIKQTLVDMKNDRSANKSLWAAWAGVFVASIAVGVSIISIVT